MDHTWKLTTFVNLARELKFFTICFLSFSNEHFLILNKAAEIKLFRRRQIEIRSFLWSLICGVDFFTAFIQYDQVRTGVDTPAFGLLCRLRRKRHSQDGDGRR